MKHLLLTLIAATLLVFVCGCDEKNDYIYDYVPVAWNVILKDVNGNNLFDSKYEGNIIDATTITYKDEEYTINKTDRRSRAYITFFMQPWTGLDFYSKKECQVLVIGEWTATEKWQDETVYINWPNGSKSKLSFSLDVFGYTNANYYVDGKKVNGCVVEFVKEGDNFKLK